MRDIIVLEITITRSAGNFKLSQNTTHTDRVGVIAALAASESQVERALARAMQEWT